jgi:hypothetical protein
MSDSHFAHHVFFCLNQREPGEGCCADCGSLKAFEHTKARVKALGLAGPGKVRVNKAADGKVHATIFSILRSNPGVVVRYTLDNSPVTAASKIDSGTPFPLPASAIVKAAMFTPGNAQPVLTTASKVAPD